MKFLHIADIHIGCWRDRKLKQLSLDAFETVCGIAIEEKVNFTLIAGDLFHTAIPSIDLVKGVFQQLRRLKEPNIPVYYIAGSHDFSPTGKTMLDIIEEAELGIDVTKGQVREDGVLDLSFTQDTSGWKLTGLIGKAGMLDQQDYKDLNKDALEDEEGNKIFLFHTALDELKPSHLSQMNGSSMNFLPEGFDYYAGGHVHIVKDSSTKGYEHVVYPGPLFPTNFREMEILQQGSYVIYEDGDVSHHSLSVKDVISISVETGEVSPERMEKKVRQEIDKVNVEDTIVVLRVKGSLIGGRLGDVDFRGIHKTLEDKGAFYVMRNTTGVSTEQFEAEVVHEDKDVLEEELIREYSGQLEHPFPDEIKATKTLFQAWSSEQAEGETNKEYEERIIDEGDALLDTEVPKDLTSFM